MSDPIKHECGIAHIRLRKPLQYYIDKYGTPLYAPNKMYLLMEKQHNRGQDGVGVANVKINQPPGSPYIYRLRSIDEKPIASIFKKISKKFRKGFREVPLQLQKDEKWLKDNLEWTGEVWMGHLRYGTHSENSIHHCHPFLRESNWRSRNLVVAGNFNMTNVDELFNKLVELGQHPRAKVDTVLVMEKIAHFLDEEIENLFRFFKSEYDNQAITEIIETRLNLANVLRRTCKDFDGGYTMMGLLGTGASFVVRDPHAIRPAYFYADEEVVVAASEKPAIKTAFNASYEEIQEIPAGHALIVDKSGDYHISPILKPQKRASCSFERIYFSRGSDPDIYTERKKMGKLVTQPILDEINEDLYSTVFSYIPNTAEIAFLGLIEELEKRLVKYRKRIIAEANPDEEDIEKALNFRPRVEKLVIKDAKLRTFIADDEHRIDLVSHIYDTTYEVIRKYEDTLVVIDDSIVRGTTLEQSILRMLGRLEPKKIVIVSSAPQIRYPDCYGIDMSRLSEFVAFRAMLRLLEETNQSHLLEETYEACLAAQAENQLERENFVKRLYAPFSYQQVSDMVARIITPERFRPQVKVIYMPIQELHRASPYHPGDWYFTGNYPTPGGNKVVNRAFLNFMEGKRVRAY